MNKELKDLNINSVQFVAENIMLKKGWTTTLEVKEELRKSGFFAVQKEVSSAMDFLAWENEWSFDSNGTYRVYKFGGDTDLGLYCYLENDKQFWEIAVKETTQVIRVGNKSKKAIIAEHRYESNRQAIIEAGRLINLREREGFMIRPVEDVFSEQLMDYFDFLTKELLQCTLYYHSVNKLEQQKVLYDIDGTNHVGYINTSKKAGYEFTFDFALFNAPEQLRTMLQQKQWDALDTTAMSFFLLGEKELRKEATLASGIRTNLHKISYYLSKKFTKKVEVYNTCLYRMDLQAKDGTILTLRQDQFEQKDMLFDLAKCFLRIA